MEVCDVWLARDFLRRARRPLDIPPCTCPHESCPPIRERNPMTTTPTDLDALAVLEQAASTFSERPWTWADLAADRELGKRAAMLLDVAPALLDELAKTRAELDEANEQAKQHQGWATAWQQQWQVAIEQAKQAYAATLAYAARSSALEKLTVSYRTGGRPSENLHRELARTKAVVDALANPATTAEPAEPFDCAPECRCKTTTTAPAAS